MNRPPIDPIWSNVLLDHKKFIESWVNSEHILSFFIEKISIGFLIKKKIRTQKLLKLGF